MADLVEPLFEFTALTSTNKETIVSTEGKDDIAFQIYLTSIAGIGGTCQVFIDETLAEEANWSNDTYWNLGIISFTLKSTGDTVPFVQSKTILDNATGHLTIGSHLRIRIVLASGTTVTVAGRWSWKERVT